MKLTQKYYIIIILIILLIIGGIYWYKRKSNYTDTQTQYDDFIARFTKELSARYSESTGFVPKQVKNIMSYVDTFFKKNTFDMKKISQLKSLLENLKKEFPSYNWLITWIDDLPFM